MTGNNFLYFEIEWSGSSWLPESLLYIIVKFSDMWGMKQGRSLQDWLRANRRPLVWADSDDSGMLMDPYVDWYGFDGQQYIVEDDRTYFNGQWKPGAKFADVFGGAPPHIKMQYRNYFTKDVCDNDEKDPGDDHDEEDDDDGNDDDGNDDDDDDDDGNDADDDDDDCDYYDGNCDHEDENGNKESNEDDIR